MRKFKFRINKIDGKHDKNPSFSLFTVHGDRGGEFELLCEEGYIIEQYTGLKDRNCKEIYDGDILEGYGRVVYFPDECRFAIDCCGELNEVEFKELQGWQVNIVGNIHENPELLEVEE